MKKLKRRLQRLHEQLRQLQPEIISSGDMSLITAHNKAMESLIQLDRALDSAVYRRSKAVARGQTFHEWLIMERSKWASLRKVLKEKET